MASLEASSQSNVPEAELLACIPKLRSFARYLTKDPDRAGDLVQDTVVKALNASHQFQAETSLRNWMMTIMRNKFYGDLRRNRLQVQALEDAKAMAPAAASSQELSLDLLDFRRAFWQLEDRYRRALILIGAGGLSYEEAARAAKCPTGTMKSMVHRARKELQQILTQGSLGPIQPGTAEMARYVSDVLGSARASEAIMTAAQAPDLPAEPDRDALPLQASRLPYVTRATERPAECGGAG